jgi:hypothetical protein
MYLSLLPGFPKSSKSVATSSGISLLGTKIISRCQIWRILSVVGYSHFVGPKIARRRVVGWGVVRKEPVTRFTHARLTCRILFRSLSITTLIYTASTVSLSGTNTSWITTCQSKKITNVVFTRDFWNSNCFRPRGCFSDPCSGLTLNGLILSKTLQSHHRSQCSRPLSFLVKYEDFEPPIEKFLNNVVATLCRPHRRLEYSCNAAVTFHKAHTDFIYLQTLDILSNVM